MERIEQRIKQGLLWAFANQLSLQILAIIFTVLLARFIEPTYFGIVAMVTVFSNFAIFFLDAGFTIALVQKQEATPEHFTTVFWFNAFVGVLLYTVFFFAAPGLASFYEQPILVSVTRVIALVFIFSSLGLVQSARLDKNLDFKRKSIINWGSNLISYLMGLILAIRGEGIWALVVMMVSLSFSNTLLLWISSSWKPSFSFSYKCFRELSSVGFSAMGDTLINYWSRNADNFLIGKISGSSELGLYSRAYALMLAPVRHISSVIARVLFPSFSLVQNDIDRIRVIYLRVVKFIALVTFPLMFGLLMLADEFVSIFFGALWLGMIPMVKWLSALGAIQSIISLNGSIYNSLGKSSLAFRVSTLVAILLIISFIIGVYWRGALGVTICYFVSSVLISIPIYITAIRLINLRLKDVARTLAPVVIAVFIMVVGLAALKFWFSSNAWITLLVGIPLGAALYLGSLHLIDRTLFPEIRRIFNINQVS